MKLRTITLQGLFLIPLLALSQPANSFEGVNLPSEQTYNEIEAMTSPGLRAAPPDTDGSEKPQKVPFYSPDWLLIGSLSFLLTTYTIVRNRTTKTKETI